MSLGVKQTTTGMGVQSPHPPEVDRHSDIPEPTGKTYLGSDRKEGAKQRMGGPGPQILTPPTFLPSFPLAHILQTVIFVLHAGQPNLQQQIISLRRCWDSVGGRQ